MSQGQSHDLMMSLRAVSRARSTLDSARTQRSLRGAATSEQRMLLAALEGYAVALTICGHPMPYKMRGELAMYRTLFGPSQRPTR